MGFASSEVMYYEKAFQALGDTRIATDDGTYGVQGNVGNLLLAADSKPAAVFACGNNGLLKRLNNFSKTVRMCNFHWNLAWLAGSVLAMLVFVIKPMIQQGPKVSKSVTKALFSSWKGGYLSGFSC